MVNLKESSFLNGHLLSTLNSKNCPPGYIDIGLSTSLAKIDESDLDIIQIPIKDLKEHLLDIITLLHTIQKG